MSKDDNPGKLWDGRFSEAMDSFVAGFTASVGYDKRLALHDIRASIAHATMLQGSGILTMEELDQIVNGLTQISAEVEDKSFQWSAEHEDVHMNVEAALTARIGDTGKKLHTARSRNDQVATDLRLYMRDEIDQVCEMILDLQRALLTIADREADTIMPGFTHLQVAQPVTFGHHMMAWYEMIERDYQRLQDCRGRLNTMPLGAAALAGTDFAINRDVTAELLGFDQICSNSLDAVSDRDFAIEFSAAASLIMVHLSRWSEEIVLWMSAAFDFVDLPDRFCTGSSIMPQKKNPDVPELVRGKSGRVIGHLVALLTLMKGQPLAYNRDNQEDKEPLFDTIDTIKGCLTAYCGLVPNLMVHREKMLEAAGKGYSTATDLADYLVKKGLPFRDAHAVVGKLVSIAIEEGCDLSALSLQKLQEYSDLIDADIFDTLTLEGSVSARSHPGGTAPDQVRAAAASALKRIDAR